MRAEACGDAGQIRLHFTVADTGIGIPREKHDRLFQPFSQVDSSTTRQFGGTGLGLAISKRLAELMGGSLWVESEAGHGSTFHFTVVVGPGAARRRAWHASPQALQRQASARDRRQRRSTPRAGGVREMCGVCKLSDADECRGGRAAAGREHAALRPAHRRQRLAGPSDRAGCGAPPRAARAPPVRRCCCCRRFLGALPRPLALGVSGCVVKPIRPARVARGHRDRHPRHFGDEARPRAGRRRSSCPPPPAAAAPDSRRR